MNNYLENVQHCITIYNRCIILIQNNMVPNNALNFENIINGFINNLHVNNYNNNLPNNNLYFRMNNLFFQKINDLYVILLNNNFNNYVQEYNNLHNLLINLEMNLMQNVNN